MLWARLDELWSYVFGAVRSEFGKRYYVAVIACRSVCFARWVLGGDLAGRKRLSKQPLEAACRTEPQEFCTTD